MFNKLNTSVELLTHYERQSTELKDSLVNISMDLGMEVGFAQNFKMDTADPRNKNDAIATFESEILKKVAELNTALVISQKSIESLKASIEPSPVVSSGAIENDNKRNITLETKKALETLRSDLEDTFNKEKGNRRGNYTTLGRKWSDEDIKNEEAAVFVKILNSDLGVQFQNKLADANEEEIKGILGFHPLTDDEFLNSANIANELGSLFVTSNLYDMTTINKIEGLARAIAGISHISYSAAYHNLMSAIHTAKANNAKVQNSNDSNSCGNTYSGLILH